MSVDSVCKHDRLESIIKLFMKGGYYTTKDLMYMFHVSQRIIQIDIKELRHMGLKKDGTKYFLPNEYRNIEIYEKAYMSAALMISMYKQAIPQLSASVLSVFSDPPKETDVFLFNFKLKKINNEPLFSQLVTAIIEKLAIEFKYINNKNEQASENIFPLKIANFNGYWYLIGLDLAKDKMKSYLISGISTLSIHNESYLDHDRIVALNDSAANISSAWFSSDPCHVTLKVKGEACNYLQGNLNSSITIIKESSTELLINLTYFTEMEVLSFIQQWLPFITIEDNNALKSRLKETLTTSLNNL